MSKMDKYDLSRKLKKLENHPTGKNLRERVSLLIKMTGTTGITLEGVGAGHYSSDRLKRIPSEQLDSVYSDLKRIYKSMSGAL